MSGSLAFLPLLWLLAGAVTGFLAAQWRTDLARWISVAATAAALITGVAGLVRVATSGTMRHELGGWPPPIGIEYILDPLSSLMVVLIAAVGLLIVIQPTTVTFRIAPRPGDPTDALLLLVLAGLTGVVLSGDLFHIFVFLEIYALATYALVAIGGDRATFAAFRYLLVGTVGASLYLLGVGFVYSITGSLNIADIATLLPGVADSPALAGAIGLITIGLAIKMALFPFHVWLPGAHSTAPPGVGALLAAIQVKAAAYLLIRVVAGLFSAHSTTGTVPVMTLIAYAGGGAVIIGSVNAFRQDDLKRLLAWSTVAQLGLIGIGIGIGNQLALTGAVVHITAHAAMKAGLFVVAGAILHRTGMTSISRLRGIGRQMPVTMIGLTIAALSMVGIPPTAGFFSKLLILRGTIDAGAYGLSAVVAASSLLTAIYMYRIIDHWFGTDPADPIVARTRDPGLTVAVPILVLTAATLILGFTNVPIQHFVEPVTTALVR